MVNAVGFDISGLTENQLFQLHDEIIDRLNTLRHQSHVDALANLKAGDEVYFDTEQGRIKGKIMRVNKKTVSILTPTQSKWKVPPEIVKKVQSKRLSNRNCDLKLIR